ncbi:Alpha-1,3/1,6-mannosyltransferase ALG2 [Pitangus sulphuratus]|nr:Alpha-1,3/1,6-mannosyltransferase ALG2 [Pitangus sulphuratus]
MEDEEAGGDGPSVLFLHPDLGLGGAERLVVDAALALRARGCRVRIWTAHYDPRRCFAETRGLAVRCAGGWVPRSLCGRGHALCAALRMACLALYVLLLSGESCDAFVCDQVSACIPILRLARTRKKVLFYCHFPDQLLTKRESFLKRLYRWPLDWLEEYTTGMADCIVVNSKFTASVFKDTFKSLSHINPDVLYPSLNISSFETIVPADIADLIPKKKKFLFLSINRYERKKNLALALEALHELRGRLDSHDWNEVHLVMAGGYDKRVLENVEHYEELRRLAAKLGVNEHSSHSLAASWQVAWATSSPWLTVMEPGLQAHHQLQVNLEFLRNAVIISLELDCQGSSKDRLVTRDREPRSVCHEEGIPQYPGKSAKGMWQLRIGNQRINGKPSVIMKTSMKTKNIWEHGSIEWHFYTWFLRYIVQAYASESEVKGTCLSPGTRWVEKEEDAE